MDLRRRGRRVRGKLAVAGVACPLLLAVLGPGELFAQTSGHGEALTGQTSTTGSSPMAPCSEARLHLRCPDLEMSAPFDLHVDHRSIAGHVLLRATSSVNNIGTGPIELRAHRPADRPWTVEQAIYDSRGRRHLFATKSRLVFKLVPGYRYGNPTIGTYSYWKVSHIAAFQLWSVDARFRAVRLVRVGPKVDYCLRDLIRTRPSARSPTIPVYPECSLNSGLRSDVLGTSVGWSDVYPYDYPQQWIDVTGLRGRFAFVMIADPRGLFQESSKRDNVSATYVELPSGRILGHRAGLAAPSPARSPEPAS